MNHNITENDFARLRAMCSDDENRPNLAHPYYDAEKGRIVATDGHRLAMAPFTLGEEPSGHVRGGPTKTKRGKFIPLEKHALKVVEPPSEYPDYEKVVPKHTSVRFSVEADLWLDGIRPLKPKKGKAPWVALLSLETGAVSVAPSRDPGIEGRFVALNLQYFLDAIEFCASDRDEAVVVKTSTGLDGDDKEELCPVRFSCGDHVCVVMPIRI